MTVCSAGMDHLQSQRLEVAKAMKEEEAERVRLEQDMAVLQSRLAHIKESLQKKVSMPPAPMQMHRVPHSHFSLLAALLSMPQAFARALSASGCHCSGSLSRNTSILSRLPAEPFVSLSNLL